MTALCQACANSHLGVAMFLLDQGADIDCQADVSAWRRFQYLTLIKDGCTPLHLAVLEEDAALSGFTLFPLMSLLNLHV